MINPTDKQLSTAQARAALAGFVLMQADTQHGESPSYVVSRHGQQTDLRDWAQVQRFLGEVQRHA